MPQSSRFGPLDGTDAQNGVVVMSVDEYETIRLIDLDGYDQEACAAQMNVSRSTVQGIYDAARKKIARSIVEGAILRIEGGDYRLCDGMSGQCGGKGCHRHRCAHTEENPQD
jgi:predicted DNA-binding protein (UPF0251 family)